jgi:glycolate oxidase FAD binding subunit
MGGIRDWVIGMKVVLADGTITKTGGRVVKNVQGYDLHRLHTGAYGTLGVIAEAAFKLTPLPRQTCTVAAWFSSLDGARELVMQTFNSPALPEAITVFAGRNVLAVLQDIPQAGDGSVLVLARVSGGVSAVARQVDDFIGAAGTVDAAGYEVFDGNEATDLWQKASTDTAESKVMARANLKPEHAFAFLSDILKMGEGTAVELHGGFGTVLAGLAIGGIADAVALRNAARKHGGNAVIERCPQNVKQELDVFPDPGDSLAVMRSVKRRFDPAGVLNPGRFVGRM